MTAIKQMNIKEILALLPHRYPFLLIDRVLSCSEKEIKAIKNISFNEPCFQGHFPGEPIFPGVLILEAMAQASGILAFTNHGQKENEVYLFVGIDQARFKAPARPGDTLILNVEVNRIKSRYAVFNCEAYIESKLICSATITCARCDTATLDK